MDGNFPGDNTDDAEVLSLLYSDMKRHGKLVISAWERKGKGIKLRERGC